jgi:hypothetical protein
MSASIVCGNRPAWAPVRQRERAIPEWVDPGSPVRKFAAFIDCLPAYARPNGGEDAA